MEEEQKPILVLYYNPHCPYCQKVLDFLKSMGKEIPLKNVENDAKAKEELLHLGGKTQVPCLFIDGKPLYESADIIDWLEQKKDIL
ncbi:MAG: glutathione S-transferase N-terminal domain-containing protein [Chlamydiales bacterium]|nr:glutathione S-transferase N-terminal domain-containing protein [Chlamydiia bacterium]MCP5504659.1 glutathione S-transferase N-terminal domain-containing protein [Chlamydiales bacterium]